MATIETSFRCHESASWDHQGPSFMVWESFTHDRVYRKDRRSGRGGGPGARAAGLCRNPSHLPASYAGALRGRGPRTLYRQPPLREKSDQDALWKGIAAGTIHVVGTDHVAYTKEQKLDLSQTVADHRAGMSNLQVIRPMLYSEGVLTGRITEEQFVAVTATNPAKLFGLYPLVKERSRSAPTPTWCFGIRTRRERFAMKTCSRPRVIPSTRGGKSPAGPG